MLVEEAMHRSGNNQSTAAALLGISQQALSKRLKNME
jgi:DNA-binding protein Fis